MALPSIDECDHWESRRFGRPSEHPRQMPLLNDGPGRSELSASTTGWCWAINICSDWSMSMSRTTTIGGLIVVRLSERRADEDDAHLSRATESWPTRFLADSTMSIDSRHDSAARMQFLRPSTAE